MTPFDANPIHWMTGAMTNRFTIATPGGAPLEATFTTHGDHWSIAVSGWGVSDGGRPVTVTGSSRDGLAVLSALCGSIGPVPGPRALSGRADILQPADDPSSYPEIDHSVMPPPRPRDWYRPPTDAEIARVLRGFDYPRVKSRHPGKWVISYSLYGDIPMYTIGALKNAVLGPRVFPEFVSRFYYGVSVPRWIIQTLRLLPQVELVDMTDQPEGPLATLWRFLPAADPDVDVLIVRDSDSRLTLRDRAAVGDWLSSEKRFHIMRDGPAGLHGAYMLAGMWGCRASALRDIAELLPLANAYTKVKGIDQEFLADHVYPRALRSAMIHDECTQIESADFDAKRPFPTPMRDPWDRAALIVGPEDES